MSLEAGYRVTPNVELSRPLGEGGMGSVWVGRHHGLDAEVAVKFVSADIDDESAHERFKREAATSAKIKSPHVVKTFDYGVTEEGLSYIVMELLEGESLGARLERDGRLVPRDVALVVSQTAQVLEEAHELGVVHRDIKPDNIFLIEAGYELFVKVLDFGIAKQTQLDVSAVTDTGAIVGTPEYMAPEQLLTPRSADWRADMWALGVLAYRALIGHVPFTGETLPSLSIAICNAKFSLPSEMVEGLPEGVDDWFVRALMPVPEDRFESVTEMAHALSDLLRNSTTEVVSIEEAITARPREQGGTLASAMSEAAPKITPRLEIAVEEAAVDPDAVRADDAALGTTKESDDGLSGGNDDARIESSRRRGPVVIEIERARSTRRTGTGERPVPSTMRFDDQSEKRESRLKLVGILLAGALVLLAADFVFRGPGEVPKPKLPASAQARSEDLWSDDTAVVSTPPVPAPSAAPTASAVPTTDATPTASVKEPAVAVRPVPARPRPTGVPTAQPAEPSDPCENPYIVQPDGSLKVKPACAKR